MRRKTINNLGLMADCSRNSVMNIKSLKKLIDYMAKMGYSSLQLYTEDTYEIEKEPYFGYLRGRYTGSEIKEIDQYAKEKNIQLIPCIQTLAHLSKIFRWDAYVKRRDIDDILLVDDEDTYTLIDHMFESLAKNFSARVVNVGMDEAEHLGLGNYLSKHGVQDRKEIMLRHVIKVCSIAKKYGFHCMMWSDMFFKLAYNGIYYTKEERQPEKDITALLPDNLTLIYWDYYHQEVEEYDAMIRNHLKLSNRICFAGGAWTWMGIVPLNGFSLKTMKPAFQALEKHQIANGFITLWGDNGGACSPFSMLPSLFMISKFNEGVYDEVIIKKEFEQLFHLSYDDYLKIDLPNVIHPSDLNCQNNPTKYLLYNDILLGIFDSTIALGDGKIYKKYSKTLQPLTVHEEWGFVFKPLKSLCDVLVYKVDLGLLVRKYYQEGNKEALQKLIKQYFNPLLRKLNVFCKDFTAYWLELYKPFGMEVMDYRLGGLMYRIKHIKDRIQAYIDGKIETIDELNEIILDCCNLGRVHQHESVMYNDFAKTISVNSL